MGAEQSAGVSDLLQMVDVPEWKKILFDLVESERMDPWSIDIVYLSRKYLDRIRSIRNNNLFIPANALLACAILLNLKADELRQYYVEDDVEGCGDFAVALEEDVELPDAPPEVSSDPLPEVLPPTRVTTRRVTLDELLSAVERVMKAKSSVHRKPEVKVNPLDDFIEEMEKDDVDLLVKETFERIKASLDSEGISTLSRVVQTPDAYSVVRTLLHVLYLANEGRVNVWQERPFDEVFISVVEDGSSSGSEEAR